MFENDSKAKWIWVANAKQKPMVSDKSIIAVDTVFFRKAVNLAEGASLTLSVSADSRYILYVNGKRVAQGPAKGDIAHQFYDELKLDDYLITGENIISAEVTSFASVFPDYAGTSSPVSVMTARGAFIAYGKAVGKDGSVTVIQTDETWSAFYDEALTHIICTEHVVIADLNEHLDYTKRLIDWQTKNTDITWENARVLAEGTTPKGVVDSPMPYRLIPRIIPLLSETVLQYESVYSTENVEIETIEKLIKSNKKVMFEKNSTYSFIVLTKQTTSYPTVAFSGGKGASVKMTYSEGLFYNGVKSPDIKENGEIIGMFDIFLPDGEERTYEPQHWRTFRFVKFDITTADQPLTINEINHRYTRYPYEKKYIFECSNPLYEKVADVSFHTLALCSHETFEDCPYYEQMQYAGDSQVISLIGGNASGDWELSKQYILQFYWSLDNEGFPQSRYPSRIPQKIVSWALLWTMAVHDYYMHTGDRETTQECLKGVMRTLQWFYDYVGELGLLYNLPYWKVVDWVWEWRNNYGAPFGAIGGHCGLITAQYAACLKKIASILPDFGHNAEAEEYNTLANKLCEAVNTHCYDKEKHLYRDCPDMEEYSELGNSWAILAGCTEMLDKTNTLARSICMRFGEEGIAKATMYGRFYVFRALSYAGAYEKFEDMLSLWIEVMERGLDAFPEEPYFARSYCHAWSAAPLYEFLSEILGVKPTSPGFKTFEVKPKKCGLKFAKGKVPTPIGDINVEWTLDEKDEIVVEYNIVKKQ